MSNPSQSLPSSQREIMSVTQLMEFLGRSRPIIYVLMAKYGLPARRLGGRWMFMKGEVNAWLAAQPSINLPEAN